MGNGMIKMVKLVVYTQHKITVLDMFLAHSLSCLLKHWTQVTGGLQMLFQVCSTPHFSVPSKGGVCGPGTLWIYFEGAFDTSFNVIYLGDDQLWTTRCTNNLSDAVAEIIVEKLCTTPKRGVSCLDKTNTQLSYLVQQTLTFIPPCIYKLKLLVQLKIYCCI